MTIKKVELLGNPAIIGCMPPKHKYHRQGSSKPISWQEYYRRAGLNDDGTPVTDEQKAAKRSDAIQTEIQRAGRTRLAQEQSTLELQRLNVLKGSTVKEVTRCFSELAKMTHGRPIDYTCATYSKRVYPNVKLGPNGICTGECAYARFSRKER